MHVVIIAFLDEDAHSDTTCSLSKIITDSGGIFAKTAVHFACALIELFTRYDTSISDLDCLSDDYYEIFVDTSNPPSPKPTDVNAAAEQGEQDMIWPSLRVNNKKSHLRVHVAAFRFTTEADRCPVLALRDNGPWQHSLPTWKREPEEFHGRNKGIS